MGGSERARTRSISRPVNITTQEIVSMAKNKGKNSDSAEDPGLEDKLNKILRHIEDTNKGIARLENKFDRLNNDLKQVKTSVNSNLEKIKLLDSKVDSLEQFYRSNNLRFYGIPTADNEDTYNLIMEVITGKMQVNISGPAIVRTYRINSRGNNVPGPILVRFLSHQTKNEVYSQKHKLKGTRITVREDLTKERLTFLKFAIETYGKKNVWTQDGKIRWIEGSKKYTAVSREQWENRMTPNEAGSGSKMSDTGEDHN